MFLCHFSKHLEFFILPDLCVETKGGDVTLAVKDKDNETSNTVSYVVGKSDVPFCFNFKMETIKIISGDYNVDVY